MAGLHMGAVRSGRAARRRLAAALALLAAPAGAAVYEVGPGRAYASIGAVPWEALEPGDRVEIHARPEPYREKWVICRQGTAAAPIVVRGIPDAAGTLPVIDGSNATTRAQLNFWSEVRGIIKIGGANRPPDTLPRHIVVEGLDLRNARTPYRFTGRDGDTAYAANASAIYVEKGAHITVRGCALQNCGNGFFAAHGASTVLVERCHIAGNGIEGSIYEHNNYTEAQGIVFQYNRFGPLRAGCLGNNLKDRSGGCVIRCNWIESGNRQLDLVDSDYAEIYGDPAYRDTYVYGNVLIEPDGAGNNQICHYGGDSGATERYRKGTLHFYHNTVYSTRAGSTTLLRLSSAAETAECRNNIVHVTAAGTALAILDDTGTANLRHNWLKSGWKVSHSDPAAEVNAVAGNLAGAAPGFVLASAQEFGLLTNAPGVNRGQALDGVVPAAHAPGREYVKHRADARRRHDGRPDLGAFECSVDADNDRMPDWWEWDFTGGTNAMTPSSDTDKDGFADWEEYAAGTGPTNPASRLTLGAIAVDGAEVVLGWEGVTGKFYRVERASGLAAVPAFDHVVRAGVPGAGPMNTVTDAAAAAAMYRVGVE